MPFLDTKWDTFEGCGAKVGMRSCGWLWRESIGPLGRSAKYVICSDCLAAWRTRHAN
jgi:hypothetical protein